VTYATPRSHLADRNLKDASVCYGAIPDLEEAPKRVGEIGKLPAAASPEWIAKLQPLVAERPEKCTEMVRSAEKKLLQELLDKVPGVSRPKVAPRKAAKKSTVSRRRATGKTGGIGKTYFRTVRGQNRAGEVQS